MSVRLSISFLAVLFLVSSVVMAQNDSDTLDLNEQPDSQKYRSSSTRYFDLLHTNLDVAFDWQKQYLLGKANLTLTPYFFEQQELLLDAKGMDILKVQLVTGNSSTDLKYEYDDYQIAIQLDKPYTRKDTFQVFVQYIAKPNEREVKGSKAITEDKGLYFINPLGDDPKKPQQIWTQGETEASSVWFPTIDAPNERCTQEISITVENRFNTLSNGVLKSSVVNADSTRTDTWSLDKPHAPYLFMMAIGEYAVIKDNWNGKPVNYHVEPAYEAHAQKIFGRTPEMMTVFSELLGYPYPWPNYDQIVVRDYVSGAMENTTSSIFMESLQLTSRELIDYDWDDIIAHELFHQWFGDLVTCESWSNLTLNEGFASYSEYLWNEHRLGRDEADFNLMMDQEQYFSDAVSDPKDLLRYYYEDKEDMFDSHSYNKGAAVLHMLRSYLGDEAFFAGLNKYLKDNAYQSVELANLRLAMEAISGEDLNWFFDQWYFFPGHPILQVGHAYKSDTLSVTIHQTQLSDETPIYRLPVFIDIWEAGEKKSYPVVLKEAVEVYEFVLDKAPDLVVFDSERQLLAEINHPLTEDELVFQMKNDESLYGRLEALDSLSAFKSKKRVEEVLLQAFGDSYFVIRQYAIDYLTENEIKVKKYETQIAKLLKDPSSSVRAAALGYVGQMDAKGYKEQLEAAMQDSSYLVAGTSLSLWVENDWMEDAKTLTAFSQETNLNIVLPMGMYYTKQSDDASFEWFTKKIEEIKNDDLFFFIQIYSEKLIGAPQQHRKAAKEILERIARNSSSYYARFAGYQALMLLTDVDGVGKSLKEIKSAETDQRLLDLYEQF